MENSDHGRSMRRLKRKPDGFTSLEISDIVLRGQELGVHEIKDNDYETFIRPLKTKPDDFTGLQLSNTGFLKIEENEYEDSEDDNDIDHQYEMFLKKLRVEGKFYALEVGKSNGVPFYLNYHVEGEYSNDEDREPPTGKKRTYDQKEVKMQRHARKDSRKRTGSPRNLWSVQGRERRGLVKYDEDKELTTWRKIRNDKKNVNAQIQARKDNGKKMGNPRNLTSVQGRERWDLVDYDEDMELLTRRRIRNGKKEVKTQVKVRIDDKRKMESSRNLSVLGRERRDLVDYDEGMELQTRQRKRNGEKEVKTQVQVRTDKRRKMVSRKNLRSVRMEYDDDDLSVDGFYKLFLNHQKEVKTQVQVRKDNKRKTESPRNLTGVQKRERMDLVEYDKDDRSVDECYQLFLNGVIKEDKYIYVCSNGTRVVYEDDEGQSSDSEIEVWDHAPYGSEGNPSPFISQRKDRSSGILEFRKKLMSILQRPFNQKEYEKLLLDIKAQKSAGHIKDLRSRPISFAVAGLTKSLLDRHRDVEREINAARHNRPKVLNILRGFFYWLENIAKEGAFKPWKDASCRAVLPACQ